MTLTFALCGDKIIAEKARTPTEKLSVSLPFSFSGKPKNRQALKTQGVWHSAQMMSAFRKKSAGILCVFQGFGATKTALVGYYDECRDVFRCCLYQGVENLWKTSRYYFLMLTQCGHLSAQLWFSSCRQALPWSKPASPAQKTPVISS